MMRNARKSLFHSRTTDPSQDVLRKDGAVDRLSPSEAFDLVDHNRDGVLTRWGGTNLLRVMPSGHGSSDRLHVSSMCKIARRCRLEFENALARSFSFNEAVKVRRGFPSLSSFKGSAYPFTLHVSMLNAKSAWL